jgi:hypothetical protein
MWQMRCIPIAAMQRVLSVSARTVHLAAFAILLGGVAGHVPMERLFAAWLMTAASGLVLMAVETAASPGWLLEVRGAVVLGKLGLLLLVPVAGDLRVPLLLLVLAVASVASHMPGRLRHASLTSLWRRAPRATALVGNPDIAGKGEHS